MSFDQTTNRQEALIPNTQIEAMFLRICTDEQMQKYTDLIDKGHISLATAYASNLVYKTFYYLVDQWEKLGGDIDQLNKEVKKNGVVRK